MPTANAASSVSAPAVVTFGPRCSEPLPRWQVLSWLRWDCKADSRRTDSPPTPPFREGSGNLGTKARRIDLIVIHCSDTRPSQDFTIEKLMACHRARGFGQWPGYHLYIRRDGTLYYCRPVSVKGCHVAGHNAHSIGVCYEGGHSDCPEYKYEDNRTAEQLVVMAEVVQVLRECYPEAKVVGHNELAARACPCFEVGKSTLAAKPPSVPPQGGRIVDSAGGTVGGEPGDIGGRLSRPERRRPPSVPQKGGRL